jgi:hypothetical protein
LPRDEASSTQQDLTKDQQFAKPPRQWYVAQHAGVAQSVEQRTRNAKVAGSIPVSGTRDQFPEVYDCLRNTPQSPPSAGFVVSVCLVLSLGIYTI